MGIRFNCPNGHKLNVKEFLAGKRGVCPQCGAKFIIPTLAEAPATESPVSVGDGLSQSIEIATSSSPGGQAATAAVSPSVVIPVVDADIELAAPTPEAPPPNLAPQIEAIDALPASIVAVTSPTVAAPIQVPPDAVIPSQRERSRRNQVVISLLLLALVVLLAGVLIWVLNRQANQIPDDKTTAVSDGEWQQVFATTAMGSIISSHPRIGSA